MQNSCDDIKIQINKIKGQINGVEKMIDEGRDPVDVIDQLMAIRSGLGKVATDLLKEESQNCFKYENHEMRITKFENLVRKFFKIT
jgi:DNA-binding FrmR family transcriptional regulator